MDSDKLISALIFQCLCVCVVCCVLLDWMRLNVDVCVFSMCINVYICWGMSFCYQRNLFGLDCSMMNNIYGKLKMGYRVI